MTPMGEKAVQVILIVVAVVVGFSILGWLLKALWWVAVIAGGIVLAALVLGKMEK
jgi:hypothetical protein